MSLDGAHHANEPTAYDESAFLDYVGTPWLSGIISFTTVIGTFVGCWAVILFFGQRHDGFGASWPPLFVLVLDVVLNVGLRLERRRRRRARGIS